MVVEERRDFYKKLVADTPEVELKGKNMLYTSDNGHMYSMINKAGEIGIRLPKEKYNAFRETHSDAPFKSHGAVMREYVCIPDLLLEQPEVLQELLSAGQAYAKSLPPK